jgi:hypothetical protein
MPCYGSRTLLTQNPAVIFSKVSKASSTQISSNLGMPTKSDQNPLF